MDLLLVGEGPATEAARAALGDVNQTPFDGSASDVEDADFAIVVGECGGDVFENANEASLAGDTAWLAIERGGGGGLPIPDVAITISGYSPGDTGCYQCLKDRIAAGPAAEHDPEEAMSPDGADERLAGAIAGRETVTLLTGGKSTLLGGLTEIPGESERRSFLPVPGCVCRDSPAIFQLDYRQPRSVDELFDQTARTLDALVGPVTAVEEEGSYPVNFYVAYLAETGGFSDGEIGPRTYAGGIHWKEAMLKAIESGLKEYALGVYRRETLIDGEPEGMDFTVDPSSFVRAEDSEPFDKDIYWSVGRRLENGKPGHVPAECVYYPPPESNLGPPVRPPVGLGSSTAEAMVEGLYDAIEQDATMLSWYSTHEPPAVTVDDAGYQMLERRIEAEGLTVTPLLVTQDIDVPVIAVAVHREEGWPNFAVGSAAHLDPSRAAKDALGEAISHWMALDTLEEPWNANGESGLMRYADFPPDIHDFVESDETVSTEALGPESIPTGMDEYQDVDERVREVGLDPYGVRITTEDIEEIDLEVGTVVVPGLQPRYGKNPIFGDRARAIPADMGNSATLDRILHPYPTVPTL